MTQRYLFGWMDYSVSVTSPDFAISQASGFESAVSQEALKSYGIDVDGAWLDTKIVPKRFEVPLTHELTVDPNVINCELAHLLISVFGFLHGLKLNPEGIGHLHRTPRELGRLVTFMTPNERSIGKCLEPTISFYRENVKKHSEAIELMAAALHWYLTSQSYEHDFEKFAWQYAVLDNIHKLTNLTDLEYRKLAKKRRSHGQRPVNLCGRYGIVLHHAFSDSDPKKEQPNADALAGCRNTLIHEARWVDLPLGYAVDRKSHDMTIALTWFNSQLILAALGIKCEFLNVDAGVLARSPLGVI